MSRVRAIPAGKRKKRKFRGPKELLAWVLRRVHYRRRKEFHIKESDPGVDHLFAMLTLIRVATGHAEAVLACTRRGMAEAAYVNLRAMLEVWADFRIVARDPSGAAFRQMRIAAGLALLRREPDAAAEAKLAKQYAAEYSATKAAIKKKPYSHWSGRGRKQVVGEECGASYGTMYELLSWDAHPVVQVLLDIDELKPGTKEFRIGHRISQADTAKLTCVQAAHILREMWNELAAKAPESARAV
ncbi:MAG: hypothetical protein ACYC1W_00815 [Gemmatimonadaceae bacterium]